MPVVPTPSTGTFGLPALTPRELEVLGHPAAGRSNTEIEVAELARRPRLRPDGLTA